MRKDYKKAKTEAEKNFIIEQYCNDKMNSFLGCCVVLLFLLLFLGLIAGIIALLRFIF